MAGPLPTAAGARSTSAGAASLTPAKPTVNAASGLLLCVVTSKNNAAHSCATAGWSQVGSQVDSGASFTMSVWQAAESAGAPTITWTGSVACSAQIAYYSDPANTVDLTLGTPSTNTGLTATHSTSAINTTRDNSLVVYIDVAAANTLLATPAGWTEDNDAGSATDAGRTVFGSKSVASSGASSGAISVAGANAAWVQWQIEVKGAAGTAGLQASKVEVDAFLDVPPGLAASKVEVNAWLDSPDEFGISKADVHAWLDYVGGVGARRRQMIIN